MEKTNLGRLITEDINRRDFLKQMAWAGSGILFTISGGVPRSFNLSSIESNPEDAAAARLAVSDSTFSFVQISDSHIGFNKGVTESLIAAVTKINNSDTKPDLLIHTGDLTHTSSDDEFDTFQQILKGAKADGKFYVPGEHDVLSNGSKQYHSRFSRDSKGDGWYSFSHKGVRFIGLVNVMNYKPGGLGSLGNTQIEWLQKELSGLSDSTPIVVFAHIPLWQARPEWGWATEDSARPLELLRRFGCVTVLNGHVHQSMQKVEGNIYYHTAMSTAYPLVPPTVGSIPEPSILSPKELRGSLGIADIQYFDHDSRLSIIDTSLSTTDRS